MLKTIQKLIILVSFLCTSLVYSYDWLRVQDPQSTWRYGTGTIEEAILSVRPQGLYMEYGLYLTFSARGLGFSNSDTLEVQFYFDLPEDAIVHDSWLWIGEDIIRGKILDKWTASAIYEDIVDRRKDPSILYKRNHRNGKRNYELRIFPMAGNETRKVKISYLAPTQWTSKNIIAALPTNLLRTSKHKLQKFHLLTWLDEEWKNPKILEFPDISFQKLNDSLFGEYIRAVIPVEAIQSTINYSIDAPFNNGLYLSKFESDNEGLYQLAFLPSKALNLSSASKVAVLFDYDASNSNISKADILNNVKGILQSNFTSQDSFNLVFSQLQINRVSENWLAGDSLLIEEVFNGLGEDPIADYSNLPSLLSNGVDFIKTNGNDGSIILISNSDQVGSSEVANQLITDLLDLMDPIFPIHIADFQNMNLTYNRIGGRYYYGNEYFYTNISRMTTANFYSLQSGYSFSELIPLVFQSLSGFVSSFDLHTKLENGFCYGRHYMSDSKSSVYLNRPVLQIGKYKGEIPFLIEASGSYSNDVFSQEIEISENNISESDTLAEEIWAGNYIKSLESQVQTSDIINEIVDKSIKNRVLSIYSAFLCLEPERGGEVCYDCLDESSLVGIEDFKEEAKSDSLFKAYPNPFNSQTKILIKLPNSTHSHNSSFKIYNSLGQVVKTFTPEINSGSGNQKIIWDGTNDAGNSVASGNYYFIVTTQNKTYSLKLILLK